MKTYRIKSIFGPTLQGEGNHTGLCVLFLRFSGCNRWTGLEKDRSQSFCSFCDTDFRGGTRMTLDEILEALQALGPIKNLILSGGEPTLQVDQELLSALAKAGYEIHLETNGSVALGELHSYFRHITLSPKQPIDETRLQSCDDLKLLFPLQDPKLNPKVFEGFPSKRRYLQPIMNDSYEENLRSALAFIYQNPEWRLSIQTHKVIGVD